MALEFSLSIFAIILLFIASKEEAFRDNKILLATIIVFIISSSFNILLDSFLVLLEDEVKV